MPKTATTRLTVDLSRERYASLVKLEEETGAASKAEILRKAILMYDFLVRETQEGGKLYAEKDGERERIVVPTL